MGGGTSPTCSVKHKLTLALLLKLAASWKSAVNKLARNTSVFSSLYVHLLVSMTQLILSAEKKRAKHLFPTQKLTLEPANKVQLS